MARRRRPMNLNIAKVNDDHAESELEQSFMVSSDAFTAAGMKVHGSGLEVIDEDAMSRSPSSRSSRASSSSSSSSSAGTSSAGGKSGESDGGSTPTSGRRSSHVGDLNPEHIEILKELGRGASSYVQLVRNKKTNKKMALKVINVFDKNMRAMLMREIKTLYKCDCHALVRVSLPCLCVAITPRPPACTRRATRAAASLRIPLFCLSSS